MVLRSIVLTIAALVASVPTARAWGRLGHDVICLIAWQETSSPARARIEDLLAIRDAAGFARACVWADEIRSSPGYGWTKPQHYVNVPRSRSLDPEADCPEQGCLLRAISQQAQRLKAGRASKAERAEALKFVAHYIGDLHQPLHVGYGDDAGGNGIAVRFCPRSCWSSVDNLHQVWDSALLKAGSPSKAGALAEQLLRGISAEEKSAWRKGDVVAWARESYSVAAEQSYRAVEHGKLAGAYLGDLSAPAHLDAEYTTVMRPAALEQLQKAAVRLAAVLDLLARGEVPASLTAVPVLNVTPSKRVAQYTVVRASPAGASKVIGRLHVGERAELLGRERTWYRVRLPNRTEGYVRTKKVRVL